MQLAYVWVLGIWIYPTGAKMRILLVEDDPAVARLTLRILASGGHVADHTKSGETALQGITKTEYDLVILDLMLPDVEGLEVVRRMRAADYSTPVLILSGITEIPSRVAGFQLGADDFLTKPFEPAELVARVEAILRRSNCSSKPPLCVGPLTLDQRKKAVTANGKEVHLTRREYAILELLASRRGMSLTKENLLAHLYGGIDQPEPKVIDVFVCRVRKKLEEAGVKGFIVTNWAQGYMIPLEPASQVRDTIAEQGTSAAQAIRILPEAAEASSVLGVRTVRLTR
jgi:two-component system, cell cycle response regulator CtrA